MHFLTFGIVLGLSSGYAPGPLITLVITETLRNGVKSGLKVALAPLITDLPIILLTVYILSQISRFQSILGIVSLVGGCVVAYMGFDCMRVRGIEIKSNESSSASLIKGVLVNALSPHPFLFWISVGAPIVTRAMGQSIISVVAFIAGFYVCIVGAKMSVALIVGKSRTFLTGRIYLWIMRTLGLALWILAILLARDGMQLMGVL